MGTSDKWVQPIEEKYQSQFLVKKLKDGFLMRSENGLPADVLLRCPASGVVQSVESLEGGRMKYQIQLDQGPMLEVVHNGYNRVKSKMRVASGQLIGVIPKSNDASQTKIFFGLRHTEKTE